MRPLTHSHTQTDRSQRLGRYTHQTSSEATPKTVFSLYGADRNSGPRQTPKFSSATAEIYHCRILAEVQLAHDRLQILGQAQGGGSVPHADRRTVHLHHHMYGERLLDSSHCDELQTRPPTIERPFQIYLTHRTTLPRRTLQRYTQVPLQTAKKLPVLTRLTPKRPHETLQVGADARLTAARERHQYLCSERASL